MRTTRANSGYGGPAGEGISRTATPRSRGALTGFGLILLGAWGALIPFVGPYFDYAFTPNKTWTWTAARFWLEVLPGAAAFLAGLILLMTAHRVVAWVGAWLGIAAGAWFVVGPLLAPLWRANYLGSPVGDRTDVAVEQIGMFYGLGAAIILLAAMAAGRFSVVGIRDVALAPAHTERVAPAYEEPVGRSYEQPVAQPVAQPVGEPVAHTGVMENPERVEQANPTVDLRHHDAMTETTQTTETTEAPAGAHRHRRFVNR
jgi:hypothetical protein